MVARIRRWLGAELPFVIVIGVIVASVLYLLMFHGHWRRGVGVLSVGLLLGAVFRGVLPPARVGMLVVRGRIRDTVILTVLGGVLLVVAIRLH
jgi:hypothetical protein